MRYNAIHVHLKERFGGKVYKVSLDIGTTCPVKDGAKGEAGCIYCNSDSLVPLITGSGGPTIRKQLTDGIEYIRGRHGTDKVISYFQHNTNTYANPFELERHFYEAIDHPNVVGLAISTRPDAISDEVLTLLSRLNRKTFLCVELGLQTANNEMLSFLKRGHTVEDFIGTTTSLHDRNISVCAHIILGLPSETESDLLNTASLINELEVEGVKIHNLHVLRETRLEELYREGEIELISLEEYAKRVVFTLEHLNPKVLIHRVNSHSTRELTVAPDWSINKLATFNAVEAELKKQDTYQGKFYKC
jgi:hypothetical protein